MGFLNNLLNKIKQNPEDQASKILPATNMTNHVQSGNSLIDAINNTTGAPFLAPVANRGQTLGAIVQNGVSQPPSAPTALGTMSSGTPQPLQAQMPEQSVMNGLKSKIGGSKLNPMNWEENTRNSVLSVVNGMLQSNYDPNVGMLGSLGNGAVRGRQNYINYNNFKNMAGGYGLDGSTISPFADYSQMTPDKVFDLGIKNRRQEVLLSLTNEKNATKRQEMALKYYTQGVLSADDAKLAINSGDLQVNSLQESNQTKNTNSRVNIDRARISKIKADIQQNQQKIGILQQRVNQGRATAGDKAVLNQLNIQNKKLLIEQNSLINQGMREQIGGASAGDRTVRPLGGKAPVRKRGGKVF